MTWADLFERASDHETTVAEIREQVASHRSDDG
jgi:hypothetical protein